MISACFFDLDGTLLNTLPTIAHYANSALAKYGIAPIPQERYRYLVGNGAKLLVERMLRERNAYSPELYTKVYNYYNESYNAAPLVYTEPYPGIPELLAALKERGIRLGIISNKPDAAVTELAAEFFPSVFDWVQGQREGLPLKPDPMTLVSALDRLGVAPRDAMYVGDLPVDAETGRRAGTGTVGVLWGFSTESEIRDAGADAVAAVPSDVLAAAGI